MPEENYEEVKDSVLAHMQSLFDEMEEGMAISHQEKYTLLEDMFESASDVAELRVAFEQWYIDHVEDLKLEYDIDDLWDQALGEEVELDKYNNDKDNFDDDSEEEKSQEF